MVTLLKTAAARGWRAYASVAVLAGPGAVRWLVKFQKERRVRRAASMASKNAPDAIAKKKKPNGELKKRRRLRCGAVELNELDLGRRYRIEGYPLSRRWRSCPTSGLSVALLRSPRLNRRRRRRTVQR